MVIIEVLNSVKLYLADDAASDTISVCSIGVLDDSDDETLPYEYDWHDDGFGVKWDGFRGTFTQEDVNVIDSSSDDDIESEPRELLTHTYVPEREPAPYAKSFVDDVEDLAPVSEVEDTVTEAGNRSNAMGTSEIGVEVAGTAAAASAAVPTATF